METGIMNSGQEEIATGKRRYVDVLNFSNHLSILLLIPVKLMIKIMCSCGIQAISYSLCQQVLMKLSVIFMFNK